MTVERLKTEVCLAINKGLGVENTGGLPPSDNPSSTAPYSGNFTNTTAVIDATELAGKQSYCFADQTPDIDNAGNPELFYHHVLIVR